MFSPTERGHGNEVKFFAKELIFMSVDQKINMINLLAPTGAMFENEKRVAFGMHPLPELAGKRYISLNWIDATNAGKYQVGEENDNSNSNQDNTDNAAGGAENEH